MDAILHERLPVAPWTAPHTLRLPGTTPISPADWLQRDEVFGAQMRLRDRLSAERQNEVHAMLPGAEAAAAETLALVLRHLGGDRDYRLSEGAAVRPDGFAVPLDGPPLIAAGRLVQEDLLVLEKAAGAGRDVLTAGVLCFPSNWRLSQKLGRDLARIHLPVEIYDERVAARVQRLFDALRPEAPLMRANVLAYGEPDLWNPRDEFHRHRPEPGRAPFLRVERQVLMRLPETGAVVFSIKTHVIRPGVLPAEQRAALEAARPDVFDLAAP